MYATAVKKLSRAIVTKSVLFLPRERQIAIERRHRGKEQYGKLRRSDFAIVSHGKSGRTWLRVLLSRFYQQKYGLPSSTLLALDNFHRTNPAVPNVFFTHDSYIRDYTGNTDVVSDYGDRKVGLLVRHPADVAVSLYFQWKYRMRRRKKDLQDYPEHGSDVELFDFLMRPEWGIARTIDFMNLWSDAIPQLQGFLRIRYEDLRRDTAGELAGVLDFLGTPATRAELDDAVAFASVENMRQMEQSASFWSGGRMRPGDRGNPESYKVRRAKVGGYVDYLDDDQAAQVHALVDARLAPSYGYGSGDSELPETSASSNSSRDLSSSSTQN